MGAIHLRPYQVEALQAIADAEHRGVKRPLIALPTGTGKTVIFAHLISQRQGRSLILAHRDELIEQAVVKLRTVNSGLDIGVMKAERNDLDHQIIVASVQTISRQNRLSNVVPNFRTIIVDEAHHSTAETYRRVLDHVRSFADDGPLTVGFTATPERADGEALGEVWQEIVYRKTLLEMITAGYLVNLKAVQVKLAVDTSRLHVRAGDFIDAEIEALYLDANAPEHTAAAYREHADGRKALVFTPTVKLAYAMAEAFKNVGVSSEALDGGTPLDERRAILQRLRSGDTPVLCNCAVLTEGFDDPGIDSIIVARPTRSRPLYIQMIGRGTRTYPGKEDCLVLDVVGATTRHDLMTLAELTDITPEPSQTTAPPRRRGAHDGEGEETPDGELVATTVDLFLNRPMHWVRTEAGTFALSLGNDWLLLVPARDGDAWHVVRLSQDGARETIAAHLALPYAQGTAEDYARCEGAGALVNPNARWRKEPASEGQVRFLRRWRLPYTPGMTKGDAADLITAAKASRALRREVAYAS